MAIDNELIDQLLTDYKKPEDIIGENGLLKQLTKAILERALEAEMTDHLGYEKHEPAGHLVASARSARSVVLGNWIKFRREAVHSRRQVLFITWIAAFSY